MEANGSFGHDRPNAVAYLNVSVHYLKPAAFRFGINRDLPVVLYINGEEVRLGSSGGKVPVVAQIPLRIATRDASSQTVDLWLEPGQTVPLYYSDSLQQHVYPVISLTPFLQTPGTWALKLVLAVWLSLLIGIIPIALFIIFMLSAIMR